MAVQILSIPQTQKIRHKLMLLKDKLDYRPATEKLHELGWIKEDDEVVDIKVTDDGYYRWIDYIIMDSGLEISGHLLQDNWDGYDDWMCEQVEIINEMEDYDRY